MKELLTTRAQLEAQAAAILDKAEAEKRALTSTENSQFDLALQKLKGVNTQISQRMAENLGGVVPANFGNDPSEIIPGARHRAMRGASSTDGLNPHVAKQLSEALADFYRGREPMATDNPLIIGSGGLSGTVPVEVYSALPTYFAVDSFAQAGATIINSTDTVPLVLPIVGAGAAPGTYSETNTSTDSAPPAINTDLVLHGTKYSRLVKVTTEALMNSALDLPGQITAELFTSVANAFTAAITVGLETALEGNSQCLVDSGPLTDPYSSLLALINAVPPRFDDGSACFMGSRSMRRSISDARAFGSGQPLLNPVDGTVLGKKFVVNDSCTRLLYGNFKGGVFIRKSPFFLQRLIEAYAASGEEGFRATQFVDSKYVASVHSVDVQPVYFTHLDGAGS